MVGEIRHAGGQRKGMTGAGREEEKEERKKMVGPKTGPKVFILGQFNQPNPESCN